jgi:hypothetical protein
METNTFSKTQVKKYSKLVARAAKCGIEIDEIMHNTSNYHGELFAQQVRQRVKNFL